LVAATTAIRPVLLGDALVGRGGLTANERRARIDGERFEPGVDAGAVFGQSVP
jgi:hypothetical protein